MCFWLLHWGNDSYLDPPRLSNFSPPVCFWWLRARGINFTFLEGSGIYSYTIHCFSWVQCFCMLIEAAEGFEDFSTCCYHNSVVVSTTFWIFLVRLPRKYAVMIRNDPISREPILVFKWVVQHPTTDHNDSPQKKIDMYCWSKKSCTRK